eukprot:c3992_g1_i1.p1 GENE.c3992_g1_i1~~c3992_g1_i1.p1  ORF type:complete len:393 (+),score=69.90 c3992_g1_i1:32-1180(+)
MTSTTTANVKQTIFASFFSGFIQDIRADTILLCVIVGILIYGTSDDPLERILTLIAIFAPAVFAMRQWLSKKIPATIIPSISSLGEKYDPVEEKFNNFFFLGADDHEFVKRKMDEYDFTVVVQDFDSYKKVMSEEIMGAVVDPYLIKDNKILVSLDSAVMEAEFSDDFLTGYYEIQRLRLLLIVLTLVPAFLIIVGTLLDIHLIHIDTFWTIFPAVINIAIVRYTHKYINKINDTTVGMKLSSFKNQIIFISYCHRDIDEKIIRDIAHFLEQNQNYVIVDYKLGYNKNLKKFMMRSIERCEIALVFKTNSYTQSENCKIEWNKILETNKQQLIIEEQELIDMKENCLYQIDKQKILKFQEDHKKSGQNVLMKSHDTETLLNP